VSPRRHGLAGRRHPRSLFRVVVFAAPRATVAGEDGSALRVVVERGRRPAERHSERRGYISGDRPLRSTRRRPANRRHDRLDVATPGCCRRVDLAAYDRARIRLPGAVVQRSGTPFSRAPTPPPPYKPTMLRRDEFQDMGEYDRDDASVRGENDPPTRGRPWKALQQEAELRSQRLEAGNTGGVEHQTREERQVEHERPLADRPPEARGRGASPGV
jgi:hypothetical protein